MRVTCFDLGTRGAVFRAEKDDDGKIIPLSCEIWSLKGLDDARYFEFDVIAQVEVKWADAIGYEHIQFNRGKSYIEGFRAILLAECKQEDRFCAGVNVSTLKKFAINGRWSDADRKKKGKKKIDGKKKMAMALAEDYPEFISLIAGRFQKFDDVIDAAWVAIWLLTTATETENG